MSLESLRSLPRDVDAVHSRQAEVEHEDVGQEGVHLVERGDAVAGEPDLIALEPQRALQHLGDLLVVLDDEHAYRTVGSLHLPVKSTAQP